MEYPSDEPTGGLQVTTAEPRVGDTDSAVVRLGLIGELDLATVGVLDRQLDQLLDAGHEVELDLAGLTFIDSTGLGLLIRRVRGGAGMIRVRRGELANQVRRLVDLTGTGATLWP